MRLDRDRPEILTPPEHPQQCCTQQTITVPADVLAKTAQKHDYPSAAHRRSYARRTGAERGFSTAKDPASNDISRGWCRLMGLAPLMLFTDSAHRPQPANPHRLEHPAGRKRPPRRPGPAPENPQTPPQDPRQPRRPAALTPHRHDHEPRLSPAPAPPQTGRQHARKHHKPGASPAAAPGNRRTTGPGHQTARMSDPNVKIGLTKT
jgi:hypothetical protein